MADFRKLHVWQKANSVSAATAEAADGIRGSTTESANHLILLRDLGAIDDACFRSLDSSLDEIGRMLTGLEKRLRGDGVGDA